MTERNMTHDWIEVDNRRWCLACGSFQVRRDTTWTDTMLGPWPGYQRTNLTQHPERPAIAQRQPQRLARQTRVR